MVDSGSAYVYQLTDGGWRLTGTRINLDSVIHGFLDGQSPEAIRDDFPTLSLEQVYGAIAFYLHNKEAMDLYLKNQEALWEELRKRSEAEHGPLFREMRARRLALLRPEQQS